MTDTIQHFTLQHSIRFTTPDCFNTPDRFNTPVYKVLNNLNTTKRILGNEYYIPRNLYRININHRTMFEPTSEC